MSLWFWLRSTTINKNLQKRYLKRGSTDFGGMRRRDQTRPDRAEKFTGRGFTEAEVDALIACAMTPADQAGGQWTLVDHLGNTWEGPIATLQSDPEGEGGSPYWRVSMTLDNPVKTPPEDP